MKSLKFKRKNAVKKVIMVCTIIISMALCEVEPVLAEEYTYDKYNRLIEVVYDDGSSVTYTYDLNGNITSVTVVDKGNHETDEDNDDQEDTPVTPGGEQGEGREGTGQEDTLVTPDGEQGEGGEGTGQEDTPVTPGGEQGEGGEGTGQEDTPVTPGREQGEGGEGTGQEDTPVIPGGEQGEGTDQEDTPVTPSVNGDDDDNSGQDSGDDNGKDSQTQENDKGQSENVQSEILKYLSDMKSLKSLYSALDKLNVIVQKNSLMRKSGVGNIIKNMQKKITEAQKAISTVEAVLGRLPIGPARKSIGKFMEEMLVYQIFFGEG